MSDKPLSQIEENDLRDLSDLVRRGNLVLFVGSGVSVEAGLPSAWDIGIELAAESQFTGKDPGNLPDVAEHYERRFGRDRLIAKLRSIFQGRSASTGVTSYDLMAELAVFSRIVTTNWDDLIEDALTSKGKPLNVIKSDQDISSIRQAPYALIKLHGDLTPSGKMVMTTKDYTDTYPEVNKVGGVFGLLGTWLQTQTVLFVGYSLNDEDFRYLFDLVKRQVSAASVRHFAIMRDVDDYERGARQSENVRMIQMTAQTFFRRLFVDLKEFANRDLEIEYICNQAKQPFVEVYGSVGCGKSELLKQVHKIYRLKEPHWDLSLVDMTKADEFTVISKLSQDILHGEITRDQLKEQVRDSVGTKAREQGRVSTSAELDRAAANRGAVKLAEAFRSRQLALFFDNMDRASSKAVEWLEKDFLPLLWRQHFEPQTKLRAVFAGRSPAQWRTWFVKSRLFQFPLSPLSENPISAMLRSSASVTIKAPLDRHRSDHMVERILWLSGGHPRAIRNLLQHLADREFAVYMGDPDGASDYFQQERQSLFESYVYPVMEPALRDLAQETKEILHSLAAFRCFNGTLLTAILKREHPGVTNSAQALLKEFRQEHLLQQPKIGPLDALDSMARYILAEWLEINNLGRYTRLHELGAKQFDYWIDEMRDGSFDSEYWRTYMVESLFHHATLVQLNSETSEHMVATFQTHLVNPALSTSGAEKSNTVLGQLKARLEEDRALTRLVITLQGQEGYDGLLQRVDERMEELARGLEIVYTGDET